MHVKVPHIGQGGNHRLSLRCPACRQVGTLEPLHNFPDLFTGTLFTGQRRCPNTACYLQTFVIYDETGRVVRSYPPELIDFDSTHIPPKISETFSEALSCRAESLHVAAAIMIRRTLEELCQDKGARGPTLKERLSALQANVVLPTSLFSALDDLRLLGNDAAHVEAKTFEAIGDEELDVAIELTKEILKAVYQLDDLVARLRALKRDA